MHRLVESLKIKDGKIFNIEFHNLRFNKTRNELFGGKNKIDLTNEITIPNQFKIGIVKCRVIYRYDIEDIKFDYYQKRKIESIKLVYNDLVEYKYKYENRAKLKELFEEKANCDDIIIIKNNLLTDASSFNIVFFDGTNYYTPKTPLLCGTKREYLLQKKIIVEKDISLDDFIKYKEVFFINAMIDLGEIDIKIANIIK